MAASVRINDDESDLHTDNKVCLVELAANGPSSQCRPGNRSRSRTRQARFGHELVLSSAQVTVPLPP
jgi:hypothetical protein